MYKKITVEELTEFFSPSVFNFKDTSEISAVPKLIGQDRAAAAICFGLRCKFPRYNIFLAGATGTGRRSYARNITKETAMKEEPADDWCYVHNFDAPDKPSAIRFAAGEAEVFAKDVKELYNKINSKLLDIFDQKSYEKDVTTLNKSFQAKTDVLKDAFIKKAEEYGVVAQWDAKEEKFNLTAIHDGDVVMSDEYSKLPPEVREQISDSLAATISERNSMYKEVNELKEKMELDLESLNDKYAREAIQEAFEVLGEKYEENVEAINFLAQIRENVLENLEYFSDTIPQEIANEQFLITEFWNERNAFKNCFAVNIFVDNSKTDGAPVIYETNPTYQNMMGKIEYESNNKGAVSTNHMLIKEGAIHRANGGYLIVNAIDILRNLDAWVALKRVLKDNYIEIETSRDTDRVSMKPMRIPINVKVLLIGDANIYNMLMLRDPDFGKLFKIYADFETDMINDPTNANKLAEFIAVQVAKRGLKHFTRDAVSEVLRYSCQMADSQKKISTLFNLTVEIVQQADVWSDILGKDLVDKEVVVRAIQEKRKRVEGYEKFILERIEQGIFLIDSKSKQVGQINGLVVRVGIEHSFGTPSRITANTYLGDSGVISIEREIENSGPSHSKGVLTLIGYIGQKYAQDMPLTLAASITMEQSYGGVDGDSASSTELYALLSSIANVPIKQYIAVTGSVNQKGEIQPIGGVSEKITGFFKVCKQHGLDGKHGVIIPVQNVHELILPDEIIEAVGENLFSIYPISNIDEGIEILTDVPAGKVDANGVYPPDSIHGMVMNKLKENSEKMREFHN